MIDHLPNNRYVTNLLVIEMRFPTRMCRNGVTRFGRLPAIVESVWGTESTLSFVYKGSK
ncbi:hypothetical protein QWZ16_22615 [Vibrio ostreicida]|uniref:Uncharacterized protein n=1 Tax=Vibrio ostreicida TaxID=526588 RepID=A0ABT8C2F3_9VIBR|nr:hypothetical protein [Vibrio ostreicida]MDN3612395.1 hypothetical protein [Vibrio ostreicida]